MASRIDSFETNPSSGGSPAIDAGTSLHAPQTDLDGNRRNAEASLAELAELARTAGVEVLDRVLLEFAPGDPRVDRAHFYLREALKGAPSEPEAAIALIEAALDRVLSEAEIQQRVMAVWPNRR
jgi:hypothetical protein